MSDSFKQPDDRHPPASGLDTASANRASAKPSPHILRPWLLFGLLIALIVVLVVRDDLRQNAALSSKHAVRYLAFDLLGWSPRDVFVWRLRLAGLADSTLGQQWMDAVERASKQPVRVDERYRTEDAFADNQVEAHVYQVTLERGEKLKWQLSRRDGAGSRFYASLERRKTGDQGWTTLTELDSDGAINHRTISQTGDYRIVLQPELLAGVTYSLAIAKGGSLPFPVAGASLRDIGGRFGAPRDGGAREHHGVDIFAKKGTPVRAVINGHVQTGTGGLGGNHVWLSGGILGIGETRYYYAHLDSFAIESGSRVSAGDIIGYVGNTGNARTTPPHLHFGIYASGPVDPAPFLNPEPVLPER